MCLIVGELLPQKNWLETQHFPAKTDSRFQSLVARDVDRSPYGNLMPPFPLSLTGVARQCSGAPFLFFRQFVYQLSQDMTQHGSHPGLSANQTPSAQFRRPIRDKLVSCGYAGLEQIVYMFNIV